MSVSFTGSCAVCGAHGVFAQTRAAGRAGRDFQCDNCRAPLVHQAEACVLLDEYAGGRAVRLKQLLEHASFRSLRIHHVGVIGPIRDCLADLDGYSESSYQPNTELGAALPGHPRRTNQDHERLTLESESVELLLSSHVLEHVAEPNKALAEASRVVKPGGSYIFSIPTRFPLPARTRMLARIVGDHTEHLVDEPMYHTMPSGEKQLVFTDFGADIADELHAVGFTPSIRRPHRAIDTAIRNVVIVARKKGAQP